MKTKIHSTVQVSESAEIGENCHIGAGVVIYPDVHVGENATIYENAVLGRPPQGAGNTTRPLSASLPPLVIGDNSVVGANAVLYGGSTFGRNVLVSDLASVREGCHVSEYAVIGRGTMVAYECRIGRRTRIMDQCQIVAIVEQECFIGPGVIMANDNAIGQSETLELETPVIRRGAAIGLNATILPGVEIGEYAIVGAGSVVTRNIPAGSVAYGVPARVIGPNKFAKIRRSSERRAAANEGDVQ